MRILVVLVLFLLSSQPLSASELVGSAGGMSDSGTDDSSYAWGLDYVQGLGEYAAFSIGYLNEGHVPDHHRDGHSIMLWGRLPLADRRLSLSAGAGSYFYFDTARTTADYHNDHNVGLMTSLAATWYTESRLLLQLRANTILARKNFDSHSFLLGLGYQLDAPDKPGPIPWTEPQQGKTTRNEISVYLGKTIVNSLKSEKATAVCVEYRRGLMTYLDGSIAYMNEGRNDVMRRNGLIGQLWLTRDFFDEHLALAYGIGGYFALDERKNDSRGGTSAVVSALNTLSISYRIVPTVAVKAHWNRMITGYDRDADVIMVGVGYRY